MNGTRRVLFLVLLVVVLGLLVWWLVPDEEDRILERLEQAALALEREDAMGVMSVIDEARFSDITGGYGSAQIEEGLDAAFRMFEDMEVVLESPRIVVEENKRQARVILRFVITGTHEGQFGFIVGTTQETALVRFIMEKNPEAGWQVTELTAAMMPGI